MRSRVIRKLWKRSPPIRKVQHSVFLRIFRSPFSPLIFFLDTMLSSLCLRELESLVGKLTAVADDQLAAYVTPNRALLSAWQGDIEKFIANAQEKVRFLSYS